MPDTKLSSSTDPIGRPFNIRLLIVLLPVAAVTSVVRQWMYRGVIVGTAPINAIVGLIQDGKAERSLQETVVWRCRAYLRECLCKLAQMLRLSSDAAISRAPAATRSDNVRPLGSRPSP